MNPLFIILFRFLQGDRLRRLTPAEERFWAGHFAIFPVYFGVMIILMKYGRHFWDAAGAFALTVAFAVVVSVLFWGTRFWGRHVPAKVSWVLSAIAWSVILFLAVTDRLV